MSGRRGTRPQFRGCERHRSSATGAARPYLDSHPDANQAVTDASSQPPGQASASLRNHFSSHPQDYSDLRGILAPIGDTERLCNATVLPPNLESACQEFMTG
jgi:hemophore-related protein